MRFSSILLPLLASTVLSMPITTDIHVDFGIEAPVNGTDLLPRATTKGNMAGIAITAYPGSSCAGKNMPYPNIQYGYAYPATVQSFKVNRVLHAGEHLFFSVYNGYGDCNKGVYDQEVKTTMGPGCYGPEHAAACFRLSH